MTPEERAAVKRRAVMACKEMRQFGFDLATTKGALKRLLKMLDYNWDAIEANNYSLLVDSLLASTPYTDTSAGEVDFEQTEPVPSTSLCDHIAPVEKRQTTTALAGEASSPKRTAATGPIHDTFEERYWPRTVPCSVGTKRKGGVVPPLPGSFWLKKPKLEPDVEPASQNVSNGHEIDNRGDKLPSDSPSALEAAEDTNRVLVPVYEHEDQTYSARKASQDNTTTETSTAVNKDGSIPQQRESACLQRNINKLGCSTSPHLVKNADMLNVAKRNFERNHEEPVAEPNIVGIKCKDSDNRKKDHPVFSVTTIEIASSSNGKVKMCLSVNNESPNFRTPDIDTVLKIAEVRCLEKYKLQQLEFSIIGLMKEVCETFVKLDRSGI